MKKLILILWGILSLCSCFGQRYEVWVNPAGHNYETKGYYAYSNDTILTLYSKSTLFLPSRDFNLRWDNIYNLKIRNKTKNDFSVLLGTAIGTLAGYAIIKSEQKGSIEMTNVGVFFLPFLTAGGGALIGHLMTCAKISIPMNEKSTKEKNQEIRNRIKRDR
jgi:hypothetical protein